MYEPKLWNICVGWSFLSCYVLCFYLLRLLMIRHICTTSRMHRSLTCIVPSKSINHSIKSQRSQTKEFGKQKTVSQDDWLQARSKIWKSPHECPWLSSIHLHTHPVQKRVNAVLSQVADEPRPRGKGAHAPTAPSICCTSQAERPGEGQAGGAEKEGGR